MEIKSELVMCPKGHYYNAAVHSACPICGSAGTAPTPGGVAGNFQKTERPDTMSGGMGSFSKTEAPDFTPGGIGPTAPAAGPVNPFSVQTTIGGDLAGDGQLNPVVGWLVCIDGPARGTDWRIHAGYNYIGRETGDIHIKGDNQISREKHAMVAFYPKTLTYFVGPAEGRNIVELNGEPVFNTVALKNYDVITVGETKLMFVALCGPHFTWGKEQHG